MALLDWLFGGGTNFAPGTYDYFRGLYPPAMPSSAPDYYSPLRAPQSAPDTAPLSPFGTLSPESYAELYGVPMGPKPPPFPSTPPMNADAAMRRPMGVFSPGTVAPASINMGAQPADIQSYANATRSIESGSPQGDYSAIGPANKKGQRAYGAYQIMDFNIPTWTKEVLGQSMTPQEFLQNPQAQDAVYKAKFGTLAQKYGPEGAARAWFTGSPTGTGSDVTGTSADEYVRRWRNAYQPNTASADTTRMMYQPPWSGRTVQPAADTSPAGWQMGGQFTPDAVRSANISTLVGNIDAPRNPAPAGNAPLGLMADNWANTIGDVSSSGSPVMSAINATVPKPPTPPTPTPRTPFNWGADNYPLWGTLTALGQGLSQPTLYGFGGALSQGISKASEFAQKAPLTAAQIQLTRAQAGMAQQKADAQAALNDFATKMNLPAGVKLSILLNPEKAYDILKVHDPSVAGEWLKYQAANSQAENTGRLAAETSPANIAGQALLKGAVTQAEQANTLGPLGKDIQDIKRILPSGTDAKGFTSIMGMTPEQYVQQRVAKEAGTVPGQQAQQQIAGFGMTRDSLNQVISILSNPEQGNLLSPKQYADLNQAWKRAVLAYGLATGRGANYTEMEKNLVESGLGQNPLDFAQRGMQDRESFIARYRNSLGYLDQQIGHIRNAPYVQPGQGNSWNTSTSGLRYRVQ